MATRDGFSSTSVQRGLASTAISSDTTTTGDIIDTAAFDMGNSFFLNIEIFVDGVYALSFEESDDSGMAGATVVTADQIIGAAVSLTAATGAGARSGNGVFSNKRFLRPRVISTGTTTGATVSIEAVLMGEYNPQ